MNLLLSPPTHTHTHTHTHAMPSSKRKKNLMVQRKHTTSSVMNKNKKAHTQQV